MNGQGLPKIGRRHLGTPWLDNCGWESAQSERSTHHRKLDSHESIQEVNVGLGPETQNSAVHHSSTDIRFRPPPSINVCLGVRLDMGSNRISQFREVPESNLKDSITACKLWGTVCRATLAERRMISQWGQSKY